MSVVALLAKVGRRLTPARHEHRRRTQRGADELPALSRCCPLDSVESRVAALLEQGRCPVCDAVAAHDSRYFFWFFAENYLEVSLRQRFARSAGFCSRHALLALQDQTGVESQIAIIHEWALTRAISLLERIGADNAAGREQAPESLVAEPCPVCASCDEQTGRALSVVAGVFDRGDGRRIADMAPSLCYTHFAALAPRLRPRTLAQALEAWLAAFDAGGAHPVPAAGAGGSGRPASPSVAEAAGGAASLASFAQQTARQLGLNDGCPVCAEVERRLARHQAWLAGQIEGGASRRDLQFQLFTCDRHVHACGGTNPLVLDAALERAAESRRELVEVAIGLARDQEDKRASGRLAERLRVRLWPDRWFERAAAAVGRVVPCRGCSLEESARDGTLRLILALLKQGRHREAYASGFGLCLHHLARAFELCDDERVRRFLGRDEAAKLALLRWELDECTRTMAWDRRSERRPEDRLVPWQVMRKFSGGPGRSAGMGEAERNEAQG